MLATCLGADAVVIKDGESIAFLGDSITYLGNDKPNGYIHLVIEGLKTAGVNATPIPAGVGGDNTGTMLGRLDKDVIAKKPTWMTLNSGVNDTSVFTVEEFGANLAKIVDQATAAGIKVILMNTTISAAEKLDCSDSLKRLQFCEEFKELAKKRNLILVNLNTAMTRELIKRRQDGVNGPILLSDGVHLNGLGNQIVAAEILRTLGVSEPDLAALRKRWDNYPFAVAKPIVSVGDYIKLKALAEKNGMTIDEQVSEILTANVK